MSKPAMTVRRQRGASMLFALMALVLLGFAAIALTRSVDTATVVMGNFSAKQDTIVAAAGGAEQAITWLQNNINNAVVNADSTGDGYYASSRDGLDPTGLKTSAAVKRPVVNWDGNCLGLDSAVYAACDVTPVTGTPVNGNVIKWVITRLCDSTGPASGANLCLRPASASSGSSMDRGELTSGGRISGTVASPYFRIIVRVEGPRNTVSYTESLVHF